MMFYPKFKRLHDLANVYIKEGVLIKYRWNSFDINSEHYHFNKLASHNGIVGQLGLNNLLNKLNVVVESKGKVILHNFESNRLNEWLVSSEYERAKNYCKMEENL